MRSLIIKKEWLDKIFHSNKRWEMRSTRTKIRGRIGLIESGSGLIVGEAVLVGCGEEVQTHEDYMESISLHQVDDYEAIKKWKYPWILESAYKYHKPIPYKHPQGAVIWVKT